MTIDSAQPDSDLFIRPEQAAYFDCAHCALPLRSVASEFGEAVRHWCQPSDAASEEVRSLFGALIGAGADDIALTPSTTRGIATICQLTRLAPGQRVVMMANEHPSQVLGWLELCRACGAEPIFVPKPANGDWTSALISALSQETAVVCFAPCHWCDGTFLNSAAIAAQARSVGALVAIDGTQAIGALPFDVAEVAPDFVVASGYKWLLGPAGLGYLYVHPRHHSASPAESGWNNRIPANGRSLWKDDELIYPEGYTRGARRFDAAGVAKSLLPRLAITGLRQLLLWTPLRIHEQLRGWNTALAATLPPQRVCTPDPSHGHTHILGVDLGRANGTAVTAQLAILGIAVSIRGPTLRVSPHFWNTAADLALLSESLDTVLRQLDRTPT
jgi:selenocysteine lyase/cysteine desulfurase